MSSIEKTHTMEELEEDIKALKVLSCDQKGSNSTETIENTDKVAHLQSSGMGEYCTSSSVNDDCKVNTDITDKKNEAKLVPNDQNGADMLGYSWGQSLNEVDIRVTLPHGRNVRGKDVIVQIEKKHLKIGLKGAKNMIIDGEIYDKVLPSCCFWNLEDNKTVLVNLEKANKMEWWPHLMVTDPLIDTGRVKAGHNLDDLNQDTREAVKRLIYDQHQRQLGLPTSDQQEQAGIIEKFLRENPTVKFNIGQGLPDDARC